MYGAKLLARLLQLAVLCSMFHAGHAVADEGSTPPGLLLWLRASDFADQANGTPLPTWRNAGEGAGDAVSTSDKTTPVKGTDPRTGKPLVLFDGKDNRLSLPKLAVPHDFTAFFACRIDPQVASSGPRASVWRPLLLSSRDPFLGEGADGYAFTLSQPGTDAFSLCLHNGRKAERAETPIEHFGRMELIVIRKQGPQVVLYRGGTRAAEARLTRPDTLPLGTGYYLGGSTGNRFFRGALAELGIFSAALDDETLEAWSGEVMARWRIKPDSMHLDDPRWFGSGKVLAKSGYYDQPYLAALRQRRVDLHSDDQYRIGKRARSAPGPDAERRLR